MPSYEEILNITMGEFNDPTRQSLDLELGRQLCEVCVNILLLRTKALKLTGVINFQANVPLNLFQYVPIADMDLQIPTMLVPINFRNQLEQELKVGSEDAMKYFSDSFLTKQDIPQSCYRLMINLLGLRPGVTFDTDINLTYVPYQEILNMNEAFPLDDNFIQPFTRLLRVFLYARLSRYELAKEELSRFGDYIK